MNNRLLLSRLWLFALSLYLISFTGAVQAAQPDTSAYQTQRLKVNALLSERSKRFGQYDQSLDQRTGIFGFQTKQDIKNSNEILRQIVLTDNGIFKELKILMDYKNQEVEMVQREASNTGSRIQNYMLSVKKLQEQNDLLKKSAENAKSTRTLAICLSVFLALALAGLVYFYRKKVKLQYK
ncbi:MAG TPA: hypothetical protein VKB19_09825 [Pedobacter sp.]|nr:hypothetical protein [Pedobacter sp.]